ncbi:MAG: DUF5060 domain-containing protein, partial [Bacteroidota bacterium]|nr:DUF5060 domain-containing protein [Bacteroidota bacterium]
MKKSFTTSFPLLVRFSCYCLFLFLIITVSFTVSKAKKVSIKNTSWLYLTNNQPVLAKPQVVSFTLINADTDQPLQTLKDGAVLNILTLPTKNLNIRANTSPDTVGRVVFALSGTQNLSTTESKLPYALAGGTDVDYNAWVPALGKYTLKGIPFSTTGEAGTELTISFVVVANLKPIANAGPDITIALPNTVAVLNGSGTDPDGTISGYKWSQVSGPNTVTFNNPTIAGPTVSNLIEGRYQFILKVKDNQDLWSAADYVTVLVQRPAPVISGELKKWHKLTISFTGPNTSETNTINPFLDYRLNVVFSKGNRKIVVPGYYAADGNAGETNASSGAQWRVHFSPDETGEWSYQASFRTGKNLAVNDFSTAGNPTEFDGVSGKFNIASSDKNESDFRAQGRLRYVGQHYLQFAETGKYFLKGGADSPENFLAYKEFDGTYSMDLAADYTKTYGPHIADWKPEDPTWQNGKGKGIIGAINYLAGKGMNSIYFLTMNVNGDGKDVWPWITPTEKVRYDVSKLDQWEIVFSHMDKMGIMLHVVTQEQENDQLLDNGDLGIQRKLYYRELIARFGHHLAITWNLGEENTNTDAQR